MMTRGDDKRHSKRERLVARLPAVKAAFVFFGAGVRVCLVVSASLRKLVLCS